MLRHARHAQPPQRPCCWLPKNQRPPARPVRPRPPRTAAAATEPCEAQRAEQPPPPLLEQPPPPLLEQPVASLLPSLSFGARRGLLDGAGRLMVKNCASLGELAEALAALGLAAPGEPAAKRAFQLWRWMYYDGCHAPSLEATLGKQNGLSAAWVGAARARMSVDGGLRLREVATAADGTRKLVFQLTEGEGAGHSVEAVLIPMTHRRGTRRHLTLCVSSQAGCAMNCQFCFTGRSGLLASLSTAQIVEQMVAARRMLEADPACSEAITNVVFMGMGEPMDPQVYDQVMAAVDIMCQHHGLHMSHNKVTVSTVGLAEQLERFAGSRVQLALSLHATTDEVRDWIVPVNRGARNNLAALTAVLRTHWATGNAAGRRVLVEYTCLAGINDSAQDAGRLLQLLEGIEAKVNLIRFNPWLGTRFKASAIEDMLAFRSVLIRGGRVCTIRDSRGDDEMAACGQLGLGPQARAAPIYPAPPRFEAALAPAAGAAAAGASGAAGAAGAAGGAS